MFLTFTDFGGSIGLKNLKVLEIGLEITEFKNPEKC
jgi:hypothetical protein